MEKKFLPAKTIFAGEVFFRGKTRFLPLSGKNTGFFLSVMDFSCLSLLHIYQVCAE